MTKRRGREAEWSIVRWLVDFVLAVVGSNPSHVYDYDSHFVRPLERVLYSRQHAVFLRCLPIYDGTTSATIRWCNGASPEVFRKKHLFPEKGLLKKKD